MKDLIIIIISLLIPPLGAFLCVGFTKHFLLNLILTLFGYLPGVVHAAYLVGKKYKKF